MRLWLLIGSGEGSLDLPGWYERLAQIYGKTEILKVLRRIGPY